MITENDEITGGEDMINLSEVTARITYLEGIPRHFARDLEDWESDELAALRDLEADMRDHTGGQDDRATAIRDSYLVDFVQDEADDIAGLGPDSYLFSYVKWDELAGDRTMDMTAARFRGTDYWIAT